VAPVAVLVAITVVVWALNRGRGAERELARIAEEHALEVAGLNVAHQVDRDALMQDLLAEATASAKLADELARIQAAAPGAKPIATVHGATPWKPVGPAAGGAGTPPPADHPGASPPVPASCPPCRLWVGDEVRVKTSGAGMVTGLGNIAVAGIASVWRRPAGDTGEGEQLHEEPLKLDVQVLETSKESGWGAGVLALAGREGWAVGPAASPPVLHVLGLDLELTVGVAVGPDGYWSSAAVGLVRW
jgi:hypothetical protein